jgi:hypothetical protein
MSGRHGRSTPGGQDYPQAATEVEATATATAIAGLRWRLWRQETPAPGRLPPGRQAGRAAGLPGSPPPLY